MHAFWMALSTFIFALFSGFGSFFLINCLTLSPFCTFSFWPFFSTCLLFGLCIFSFLFINVWIFICSFHTAFVLVILGHSCTHTYTHTHTFKVPHLLPSFPFSVLSLFLHSSLLPKDKRSGVSMSGGACGGERSTTDFLSSVAMNSALYPYWLFSSMKSSMTDS